MNPANRSIIQASVMTSSIHARNRWSGILGLLLLLAASVGTTAAGEARPLPAPEIKPRSGTYCVPVPVVIETGGGRGVEVRYTVDGTDPTVTSWLVRGPVLVTDDTVLKARAFAPGNPSRAPSPVATATYRVTAPLVTARPTFAPPAGLYVDTVSVTLSSSTSGAWIAYTTDGSEPTFLSPRYAGPIPVVTPTTVRARAFGGWFTVSIFGRTVRLPALFPSGVASATYNLQVGTPAFSVAGGLYRDAQSVTVTTPTPSATLTYTTDGSEPTAASPRLSGPVAVARSQSVRVRGFRDGFVPSAVATAAYELKVREPTVAPPGGTYSADTITATIASNDASSQTRYTDDGTVPSASSPPAPAAVDVRESLTLTARSFRDGWTPSDPVAAAYRLRVATPSLTPGGLFTAAITASATTATRNAVLRYAADGTVPTESSPVMPASLVIDQVTTLTVVGFREGFEPSVPAAATYRFQVQAPALTLASGTYREATAVSASTTTPGAVLRYTTDGTDPQEGSSLLSGSFDVTRTVVLKVRGFRPGYVASEVAVGSYELKAKEPTIAPPAGIYTGEVSSTITAAAAGDTVRYTLDGSEPDGGSAVVAGPIRIDRVATMTARSFRDGWTPSDAVAAAYRLRVTTPVVSPAGGAYTEAATVTATVATADAVMRYTVDGTDPSAASPVLPAALTVDHPMTLRVAGFRDGFETSDVAAARFDFYVATPSATLAPGTYRAEQSAGFACATTGATLTYTTDGTDPTPTSAAYVGPIAVARSEFIRVRGFREGFLPSAVLAAAYELKAPEPTVAPAGGTFTDVTTAAVQAPAGAMVRYAVDGTTPAEASPEAPAVFDVTRSETLTVRAFRDGWTASDAVAATFVLQVATPSLDPTPGDFSEAVAVTATSGTPASVLRYTTDGSDPTETSPALPEVGVSVERTTTIAVRGFRDGFDLSQTASGLYRFPPMISFVTEASSIAESGGTVVLDVQLSEPAEEEVSFSYELVGGEATAADLGPIAEGVRVVIPAGATSGSINIPIIDEAVFEADETAVIALTDWTGAVHKPGHIAHTITIADNDTPPTVAFAQPTGTFAEEAGLVEVALALSAACEVAVEVDVISTAGTAASDVDYMSIERRIRFEPGQTTVSCPVMLLDDGESEGDEYVTLTLRQSGSATVGPQSSYRLVITSAERRLETVVWQQKALAAVARTNTDPPAAARIYALLGVAQRRAARAADGTSVSPQGAVVAASARVLSRAFPALAQSFAADAQADAASPNWSGYPLEDVTGAAAPGRVIADRVMDAAASDGASALWAGAPPVGAGYWYASWAYAQPPLRPLWGQVRPWFLTSGDEYRPAPPPAFGSSAFVTALTEVRTIADHRTDEQLLIAGKWSDGPGTPTPAGKWCSIAGDLALQHGLGEAEAAQLFGLLGATMMDASIACWDAKYAYWLIRPYQADRSINTPTGQPNFPSYVSGHATFSGAASEILAHAFPDSAASVRAMAEEAAMSRLYGSIHYRFDNEDGLVLGRQVAAKALADDADGSWLREITPQVAFVFPAPAQILGSGTVAIQASISDDGALDAAAVTATLRSAAGSLVAATVTVAPGSSAGTATLTITPAAALPEGIYQAIVSATDADGHAGSGTLSFGVDPNGAPVVTILTPTDRDLVGMEQPVVLTGRINQPVASATVNGAEIAVGDDLTFSVSLTVDPNTGIRLPLTLMGGLNELLVRATDASGKSGTARIDVLVDDHAPTIAIESPADNSQTTAAAVHVAGRVQDLVLGQVTSDNMTVTVNGEPAEIRSGNFLRANVPLAPGANQIAVEARDQAGNLSQTVVTVTQVPTRGIRMDLIGGDLQEAETRTQLGQPLAVRLTDPLGAAVDRHPVTFTVSRGDGQIAGSTDDERRKLTILTDANGEARAQFVLGGNAGVGNQRVTVTSMGVLSGVTFTASATHGPITAVYTMMGDRQTGFAGQAVPWPLVVSVQDFAGNPAAGVAVQFQVQGGTSALVPAQWVNAIFRNPQAIVDPQQTIEVITDQDGRAAATIVLGAEVGPEVAEVKASVVGHPEARTTTLVASAVSGTGNTADTSLVGIVLSTEHKPIPGVTLVIEGTTIGAVSGADGRFAIVGAPPGHRHLMVNGTTANQGAIRYPTIGFEVDLLSGATISMPMPIYLPTMDRSNEVLAGGDEEVTLQLPGMPGVEVVIAPHSTIRADGVRGPVWMWTSPVNAQAIPMPPPGGIVPTLAATLQPSGTRLDPPARIRWPNTQGMLPGSQAFMLSFDHDLGAFVSQGTITVSDDGAYMTSDAGSGLSKAGWHFPCDTPIPTGDAEGDCLSLVIEGPAALNTDEEGQYVLRDANGFSISSPSITIASINDGAAAPITATISQGKLVATLKDGATSTDPVPVKLSGTAKNNKGKTFTAELAVAVTPTSVILVAIDYNHDGSASFGANDVVPKDRGVWWWLNGDHDNKPLTPVTADDTFTPDFADAQVNGDKDVPDWIEMRFDGEAIRKKYGKDTVVKVTSDVLNLAIAKDRGALTNARAVAKNTTIAVPIAGAAPTAVYGEGAEASKGSVKVEFFSAGQKKDELNIPVGIWEMQEDPEKKQDSYWLFFPFVHPKAYANNGRISWFWKTPDGNVVPETSPYSKTIELVESRLKAKNPDFDAWGSLSDTDNYPATESFQFIHIVGPNIRRQRLTFHGKELDFPQNLHLAKHKGRLYVAQNFNDNGTDDESDDYVEAGDLYEEAGPEMYGLFYIESLSRGVGGLGAYVRTVDEFATFIGTPTQADNAAMIGMAAWMIETEEGKKYALRNGIELGAKSVAKLLIQRIPIVNRIIGKVSALQMKSNFDKYMASNSGELGRKRLAPQKRVQSPISDNSPWHTRPPWDRGWKFQEKRQAALKKEGYSRLPDNYKTIDNFRRTDGKALSIKSRDLTANTYQDELSFKRQMRSDASDLSDFKGNQDPRFVIELGDVKSRDLEVIVPKGMITPQQQGWIESLRSEMASLPNPVTLIIREES